MLTAIEQPGGMLFAPNHNVRMQWNTGMAIPVSPTATPFKRIANTVKLRGEDTPNLQEVAS